MVGNRLTSGNSPHAKTKSFLRKRSDEKSPFLRSGQYRNNLENRKDHIKNKESDNKGNCVRSIDESVG